MDNVAKGIKNLQHGSSNFKCSDIQRFHQRSITIATIDTGRPILKW